MPIPAEIPISKHFSSERIEEIHVYTSDRLTSLIRGLRGIREDKISKWRKVYAATPREKTKSFPWQNASNIVIPLVGSFVDQLVAKIVMSIFGIDPLFSAGLAGEWDVQEKAEQQREAIEEWLAYAGLEPSHMNILPKYTIWIRNQVKYGFGAIKILPELSVEQVAAVAVGKTLTFTEHTRHDGPVVLPLMFEDFLMPASTVELERSPICSQLANLERFQLEAMKEDVSINQENLEEALKSPTRQGPSKTRRMIEEESGAKTDSDKVNENWDVYESYFTYQASGKKFQIISTDVGDDSGSNFKNLKAVFNWLPENSIPYIGARLGSDGENAYGLGFCEMLKDFQEEVSAIHNRRGDASTAANTNIFRTNLGTQLDSQYSLYPMAIIPGDKDSFEVIPLGRTAGETIKDEQMSLQEAQDRAGVGPSSSGQGAGTVNKKGAYSAMSTYAVMQEGDARANLNKTEFKQAHYCFGRMALLYYAHFGVSEKDIRALGRQGKYLSQALENVRAGRILLPIRAATGSVNKEIEKQNLMLLLNNTRAHYQMVNQLMQGASNPMAPPEMQDYLRQVIMASNLLMRKIVRDFGIPDPSSVLPEPMGIQEKLEETKQQMQQQQQKKLQAGNPNGGLPQPQVPGAPIMGGDGSSSLPQ